jgi:curved DNA-binding protein CbpA
MSAPVAGNFQDHYSLFGIEHNADSETIQATYTRLAAKYHPDNPQTGDAHKFECVNQAYEVLCDPQLRAAFDKVKGVDLEGGNPKFSGAEFFRALAQSAGLRAAVLCILYDRRRMKSFKPSLSMRHLEGMLYVGGETLNFALWYLKKRGLVLNDDKSALEITVEGMDFLEQNRPTPEQVMGFIRRDALTDQEPLPALALEKPAIGETTLAEPLLNVLNRALQRNQPAEENKPLKKA